MKKLLASVVCWLWCLPAGAAAEKFQFVIVGDRTGGPDQAIFEQAVGEMAQLHAEFAVTVGDQVEGGNPKVEEEWDLVLETLGRLQVPVYYVAGNNDIWDAASEALFEERTGRARYYSFDYGHAHFVVLDNSRLNSWEQDEEQIAWLKDDLARHAGAELTFCVFHKPFWYSADPASDPMHAIFSTHGVDVVISGHYHNFARAERDGIQYVIIGSSGGAQGGNEAAGQFYGYGLATVTGAEVDIAFLQLGGVLPESALVEADVKQAREIAMEYVDVDPLELREGKRRIRGKTRVRVMNARTDAFEQTVVWTNENPAWVIKPQAATVTFPPGEETAIEFAVELRDPARLYPLPEIGLSYPTDGWGECTLKGVLPLMRSKRVGRSRGAPAIDGRLDDNCWAPAQRIGELHGTGGEELDGDPTAVYVARDVGHLYLGIRCEEAEVSSLKAVATERDSGGLFADDWIMLFFDVEGAGEKMIQLVINPAGVFLDRTVTFENNQPNRHPEWNANLTVATGREPSAWTLEIAIPYEALGAEAAAGDAWGFNVGRMQKRTGAYSSWQTFLTLDPQFFGKLVMK